MSKSYTELVTDASKTSASYLYSAIRIVNEALGEGAATKYPEIVAGVVQASALDYLASVITKDVTPGLTAITDSIYAVKDSLK